MPRIRQRPQVQLDLADIWDYIADDSVQSADRLLDQIAAKLGLLAENPLLGRAREELMPRLRSFPMGHYVIFYMPQDDGIEVVRVLHGARDIQSESFAAED